MQNFNNNKKKIKYIFNNFYEKQAKIIKKRDLSFYLSNKERLETVKKSKKVHRILPNSSNIFLFKRYTQ